MQTTNKLWSIDSMRLTIPIEDVTIIDESLFKYFQTIEVEKELTENISIGKKVNDFKTQSYKRQIDGINLYISKKSWFNPSDKKTYNYLIILFSSKINELFNLNYFDGISKISVFKLLLHLENVCLFRVNSTKNISIGDVDIKKDISFNIEELIQFKELLKAYKENYKQVNKIGLGVEYKDTTKNMMLQVNRRENSTISKPFMKWYDKTKELKYKSNEFYNNHLKVKNRLNFSPLNTETIIRAEFTLKNKSHLDKYELSNNLFKFLKDLSMNQRKFDEIYLDFIKKNFEPVKTKNSSIKVSPTDKVILNMFKGLSKYYTYNEILILATKGLDKKEKSRKKKLLNTLYNSELYENVKAWDNTNNYLISAYIN